MVRLAIEREYRPVHNEQRRESDIVLKGNEPQ